MIAPGFLRMAVAGLAPAVALAGLNADDFRWSRPLEGAPVAQTTVAAVPLDAAVFAAAAEDFSDLRLLGAAGVETPRAIEKVRTVRPLSIRRAVAAQPVALRELPDNRIEAEFELVPTNAVADGFKVVTPLHDFQHQVKVEGSRDGRAWTALVEGAPLLDYTRYLDLRQLEVELPPNAFRRFKLTISNVTGEQALPISRLMTQTGGVGGHSEARTVELRRQSFRVDRVCFWRVERVDGAAEEARADWPLDAFTIVHNEKQRATMITLPAGRRPLNRLTLEFAEHNFSRPVTLQVPVWRNGVEDWEDFASGHLLDIALAGLARQELALLFPETRPERVRLVLHDGDNPPLTLKAVTGSGPVYRVLFLAAPGASYRLLYGSGPLARPHYELDTVLAPVRHGLQPVVWRLGPPVPGRPRPAAPPLVWLNSPWLFGAALVLMLLVLGALLLHAARTAGRRLDARPPGSP